MLRELKREKHTQKKLKNTIPTTWSRAWMEKAWTVSERYI